LQPCLAACVDQQYKILVTHATYPNEDAFEGTVNFCLTLKKVLASCTSEKRGPMDLKYPDLCVKVQISFHFIFGLSDSMCLSSSLALHFSDYSFLIHHPINWDDWHLFANAMACDFTVT
jgi:hypothetical protein